MVKLNSYKLSAKDLGILKEYSISGYSVEDWISDIKFKFDILCRKEEENKLKVMETKLHQLLSSDKKVELEIDEIMSQLNL
jgi:hypothetical protein